MSDSFANYLLTHRLGGGGLGEVFRAEGPIGAPTKQICAIKRLARERVGAAAYQERFRHEAMVASTMQHPTLVGALASGETSGWPFFVMPYIEGPSLATWAMGQEPYWGKSPQALQLIVASIFEAIKIVHERGFTHNDLSPTNVLLDAHKTARLADFGAASAIGSVQPHPIGTYAFMSPEQVRGEALSEASDVFALAALLWSALLGRSPFATDTQHTTLVAVVTRHPPPMPKDLRNIDTALRPALHKKPGERPSLADFRSDVLDALSQRS